MLSLYFPMISSIQSAIYFDDAISGHLFRVARKVRKLSASNVCIPSTLNNSTIGALADDHGGYNGIIAWKSNLLGKSSNW